MKCHYEVLGLEMNCTSDELKKAYRKLALEWHPDKNLDRLEEAKENFQLIQQAYDILSDPQERAWYDRHRDDIVRGGAEEAYKDNSLDVYQYFNTSCFKGYGDDDKGFYTVYRQVFEKISAEDKPFMDEDDEFEVPQFGYSYSPYEEVHEFYAYWQSYCTAKSFSWQDKFVLNEARRSGVGRQVIRAMEKENKKVRDMHKKARNEEVRELVAFVRKRDKRVQAQKKLMEEMKAERAKKAEELRRKKLQERNKALEDYKESEWSSMSQFENHFNEIESALDATFGNATSNEENEGENDNIEELYCVACDKDFRSEKAFKNHENSKKHKENVLLLKSVMVEEEELANSTSQTVDGGDEENLPEAETFLSDEDEASSKALLDELIKSSTKSKKKKKGKSQTSQENDNPETIITETENLNIEENSTLEESIPIETEDNTNLPKSSTKYKKKKKGKAQTVQENVNDKLETNDIEIEIENLNIKDNSTVEESIPTETDSNTNLQLPKSSSIKKKGKKDKVPKTKVDTTEKKDSEELSEKPITICGTCNNNFPSRNKLFEHLKQTGHAVYKPDTSAPSSTGKKQKKKKL